MKLERVAMLAAINCVKPALAAKDLVEELTHCWFDGETVTAYNDADLGIQAPFKSPFKGGIRGSILLGLLHNSRAKEVELEPQGEGQMLLKAARARVKLAVLDEGRSVWQFPEMNAKKAFPIGEDFIEALKAVLVSVGNDTSIPEKLGVTLIQDDDLFLFTTDSRSIARASIKAPTKLALKGRVILPTAFCGQLLKICADGGSLELREDCAIARNEAGVHVYARLVEVGKPLDFPGVFGKHMKFPKAARFEVPPLLGIALERALVLLDGATGETVTMHACEGTLRLEASHPGHGELKDSIKIPETVPEVVIKIDPDLIKRALPLSTHIVLCEESVYLTGDGSFSYLAATSGG